MPKAGRPLEYTQQEKAKSLASGMRRLTIAMHACCVMFLAIRLAGRLGRYIFLLMPYLLVCRVAANTY